MASLNKVILIGNLGHDPDLRFTQGGTAVANFNLATSEKWKDKGGNTQEKVEWHKIVVWGKIAEHCKEYLAKGRPVYIEGKLQTREWTDKEGQKRYTTEVLAQTVTFLGTPPSNKREEAPPPSDSDNDGRDYDDIPF